MNAKRFPKFEEMINPLGDLVYRMPQNPVATIIRKKSIDRILGGRALDNVTVWEVIAVWEKDIDQAGWQL